MLSREWIMALVALLSALKSACKTGGTDCYCLLPNDHTAEGYVQQVWCFRAHACESSFGLSANEFAARYGEDTAACMMGPEVPFASTVLNAGIGPSGVCASARWRRLLVPAPQLRHRSRPGKL